MRDRLTYKSNMGDYGSNVHFDDKWEELCALRNKLGVYEDNEWKSIKEDGLPNKYGLYEVTAEKIETKKRYVTSSMYIPGNPNGFSLNESESYKVVAWRYNVPYDGE